MIKVWATKKIQHSNNAFWLFLLKLSYKKVNNLFITYLIYCYFED